MGRLRFCKVHVRQQICIAFAKLPGKQNVDWRSQHFAKCLVEKTAVDAKQI